MSVYSRKGSPFFQYEFEIQGARFRGSTKETTRRAAERAEARIRAQVEERLKSGASPKEEVVEMTLGSAVTRFWLEKAQHESDSQSVWYQMENLVAGLGKNTLLSEISMSDLAKYQARRRGQKTRFGRLPANQTINAECPDLIRRIFNRAENAWSDEDSRVNTGATKKWAELKLRRPKPRKRELSVQEEARLNEHLREDYADVIEFAMLTGLRRAALLLRWSQVDLDAGVITYERKSLHDDDIGFLPITARMRVLLLAQKGRNAHSVWTYVAKSTRNGRKRGKRYPITEEGLKSAMRRAITGAGITDWRVIHDLRHTAATRTLRASKNIKAVQGMLGHSDIASTSRYAHVLLEDVREAMDAASPRKSPTIVKSAKPKSARKA